MKRLISILMIISLMALSLVVPVDVSAASVDVSSTGNYISPEVDYGYDTPYVTQLNLGTNNRGCPSRLDVEFHSVSHINYYRLFCKLVDNRTGEIVKDWKGVRNIHDGGKWYPTTSIYLDDAWFSDADINGYWSDSRGEFVGNRFLRIYVTVRGISYPACKFLTGYYDNESTWWRSYAESGLCPTIEKANKTTTGTNIKMTINTAYPLSSAIKYYRVYCYVDGDWVSLGDYDISSIYNDSSDGRRATIPVRYTNTLHNCDNFWNGTSLFTVRGLDKNKRWCTPFMKHYLWTSYVKYN